MGVFIKANLRPETGDHALRPAWRGGKDRDGKQGRPFPEMGAGCIVIERETHAQNLFCGSGGSMRCRARLAVLARHLSVTWRIQAHAACM